MLFELSVGTAAFLLLQGGHSPRSAARLVGRLAGRAAGSVRRVRAEVARMQARAEAAGGADLQSSELGRQMQQLRMVRAETSSLLRMRPQARWTADGQAVTGAPEEFSDEELQAAVRAEMGVAPLPTRASATATPVAFSPAAPPRAALVGQAWSGAITGTATGAGTAGGQAPRGSAVMLELLQWEAAQAAREGRPGR
jgi:hypothetical protein